MHHIVNKPQKISDLTLPVECTRLKAICLWWCRAWLYTACYYITPVMRQLTHGKLSGPCVAWWYSFLSQTGKWDWTARVRTLTVPKHWCRLNGSLGLVLGRLTRDRCKIIICSAPYSTDIISYVEILQCQKPIIHQIHFAVKRSLYHLPCLIGYLDTSKMAQVV